MSTFQVSSFLHEVAVWFLAWCFALGTGLCLVRALDWLLRRHHERRFVGPTRPVDTGWVGRVHLSGSEALGPDDFPTVPVPWKCSCSSDHGDAAGERWHEGGCSADATVSVDGITYCDACFLHYAKPGAEIRPVGHSKHPSSLEAASVFLGKRRLFRTIEELRLDEADAKCKGRLAGRPANATGSECAFHPKWWVDEVSYCTSCKDLFVATVAPRRPVVRPFRGSRPPPPPPPPKREEAGTSMFCEACGCRWKRHADKTFSLYDAQQKPCAKCDAGSTASLRYEAPPSTKPTKGRPS